MNGTQKQTPKLFFAAGLCAPYSPPSGALAGGRDMDTATATTLYARKTAGFDERVESARRRLARAAEDHAGPDRPGVEPRRRGPGPHRPDRARIACRSPSPRSTPACCTARRWLLIDDDPRALRHSHRALPPGARGGDRLRRPPRQGRDAAKRRAEEGVLRDAQGRAARPHARRPHGVDHRPAPRAVERARRGRRSSRSTTPAAASSARSPTGAGPTSGTTST